MNKIKVVTAYVPLPVKHLNRAKYMELGEAMLAACPCDHQFFADWPLEKCWAYPLKGLPPACPVPTDRYENAQHNVFSNIVQHNRTEWAMGAMIMDPTPDVFVWIDLGVLKQGDFTGNRVQLVHLHDFIQRLQLMEPLRDIPFPGIWPRGPIAAHDVNWRFVGSLHIWPRRFLAEIDREYKKNLIMWAGSTQALPNDLPIWALTEQQSALPFKWYAANHDFTQFTNFPGGPMTPLCYIAAKYGTDKGGWHTIAGDTCHDYTPVYHDLLKDKRQSVKRVLEIGVNYGCSVRMWEEYFPHAEIIGLDSNAAALVHNSDRITCYAADQGREDSLLEAMRKCGGGPFDLIVDDGSHEREHQILSAQVLYPFLAEDGVYVIEDIYPDCQPELIADHLPGKIEFLPCKRGIGKAHCGCGCGKGETLIVMRRG